MNQENTEGDLEKDGFFQLRKFENLYKLENYIDCIEEFTPRTIFISLTEKEISHLHKSCNENSQLPRFSRKDIPIPDGLNQLVEKVDDVLKEFPSGAFIKLSSRSPKDFYYGDFGEVHPRYELLLQEELELSHQNKDQETYSKEMGDLIAMNEASRKIFHVKSGKESMEIMIQSDRIRGDLMKYEEYPSAFDNKLSFVIREWIEEMDPIFEFRGFVFQSKLCCLSQYCYTEYYPHIIERKRTIQTEIQSFFEKEVQEKLGKTLKNYVIDFSIIFEGNSDKIRRIYVIELNPYYHDTGACLFRWGRDKEVMEGRSEFEFRILDKRPENQLDGIPTSIGRIIESFHKKNEGGKNVEIDQGDGNSCSLL